MYTSFMQVTPGTISITIEAPWSAASADYAEVCARFCNTDAPGVSDGEPAASIPTERFSREIPAETIRRCAARLIRSILMEKGIRTVGPLVILKATLEPGRKFYCTIELMLRPEAPVPGPNNSAITAGDGDSHLEETRQRTFLHANCDPPESADYRDPAGSDTIPPDSILWNEAAHNALLHVIAHEVAEQHGLEIDKERLKKHLKEAAKSANTTPAKLWSEYDKNGRLEVIREYLLIEAALDYLTEKEQNSLAQESAGNA